MQKIFFSFICLVLFIFLGGCSLNNSDLEPYQCVSDSDCVNTCTYGAINRSWFGRIGEDVCLDGCAGPWSGEPKCVEEICTAYTKDGKVNSGCTTNGIKKFE